MKKITIISLHLGFGGIEKYISNLCKMLEEDFLIDIICVYKFNDIPAFDFSKNIKIKYLVEGNPKGKSLKSFLLSFNIISFVKETNNRLKLYIRSNSMLKEKLKNLSTDYVITTRIKHNKMVGTYCEKPIIKISTEHNHHQNNKKYIARLKKSLKGINTLVVPTKELYNYYNMRFNIKCEYIQNHIDEISKERTNFKNKNIISVGRFSLEKGFLDLIDVFKIINLKDKKIKLYLLGDGYLNDKIRDKVKEYNLEDHVIMPGFVSESDQKEYYMDSSLYVMTSITEAFGLVLLEAMSYGLPCIAFDSASGPRELIKKESGFLIKKRNKEKMAKTIINLLNDKKELKKLQKQIDISSFEKDVVKEKWLNLLSNE